jgi:site-specific DNA-cytosine methylase
LRGREDKAHVIFTTVSGEDISHTLNTANGGKHSSEDGTGRGVPTIAFNAQQDPVSDFHVAGALQSLSATQAQCTTVSRGVRRLTPKECERLQGLPDGWTLIPTKKVKKLEADFYAYLKLFHPEMSENEIKRLSVDDPRYKAIGNGMAVPCVTWVPQA